MRISDWSSDVCSSDLADVIPEHGLGADSHLFVRPQNTRLTRPGQAPSLQFQGRITQMLFVGTHYKLVLDIGAGTPFNSTVQAGDVSETDLEPGATLDFWIDHTHLRPLPDDGAAL